MSIMFKEAWIDAMLREEYGGNLLVCAATDNQKSLLGIRVHLLDVQMSGSTRLFTNI